MFRVLFILAILSLTGAIPADPDCALRRRCESPRKFAAGRTSFTQRARWFCSDIIGLRYRGSWRRERDGECGAELPARGTRTGCTPYEYNGSTWDVNDAALAEQAAGMVYAWEKIEPMSNITAFHYHNWVDNRGEGGLRIGLRKFPDDEKEPLGKKPIWGVYQAIGTSEWREKTEFALPIVGIKSWSEVFGK